MTSHADLSNAEQSVTHTQLTATTTANLRQTCKIKNKIKILATNVHVIAPQNCNNPSKSNFRSLLEVSTNADNQNYSYSVGHKI